MESTELAGRGDLSHFPTNYASQPQMSSRHLIFAAGLALPLLVSSASHAEPSAQQQSLSESLFQEGQKLMGLERFTEACEKFEESFRLVEGGGTELNLANCYAKSGRTATAWATFQTAAARAKREGRSDRVAFAEGALQELEPKLMRLSLELESDPACSSPQVTVDGVEIPKAALNVPTPFDPGEHTIHAGATGCAETTLVTRLDEAGATKLVRVRLNATATSLAADSTGPGEAEASNANSNWIYALGGLGVIGLGVGTGFGIAAMNDWAARNEACQGGCNDTAVDEYHSAQTNAITSTVAFSIGGAALAGAAILYFTGKPSSPTTARYDFQLVPSISRERQTVTAVMKW